MLLSPRSRLLALVVVPTLAACGSSGGGGTSGGPQVISAPTQLRTDNSFATRYYVQDMACQQGAGTATIGATRISTWQNGVSTTEAFPFTGATSSNSLAAPGILGSYFGLYQKSSCTTPGDPTTCGDPNVVTQVSPLQLCKTSGTYDRVSVEGVALSSLSTISTAYNFYETVPGHSTTLQGSELLVLPSIEDDYTDGTYTMEADNLAYTSDFGGQPAFVVFPKSAQAVKAGLWKTVNLWELPWGLAHEFGHHVFRTHTGIDSVTSGLHGNVLPEIGTVNLPRSVGSTDYWGAVNEGYADLFSYYTWGAKPGLVKNVDCFDANRDVSASNFASGTPKILTQEVLNTFESGTTAARPTTCSAPYFQDIHAIGAIVAHGVDQVFLATVGSGAAVSARGALQLAWAENLRTTVAQVGQANLTLDVLVEAALRAAAPNGNLNSDACAAAKTAFPTFLAKWKADGISCS